MTTVTLDTLDVTPARLAQLRTELVGDYRSARVFNSPIMAADKVKSFAACVMALGHIQSGRPDDYSTARYLIVAEWVQQAHRLHVRRTARLKANRLAVA